MFCVSCTAPLDRGVVKLAESLGATRVICAWCLSSYAERDSLIQMNVRIPRALDAALREEAHERHVSYAFVVREKLSRKRDDVSR